MQVLGLANLVRGAEDGESEEEEEDVVRVTGQQVRLLAVVASLGEADPANSKGRLDGALMRPFVAQIGALGGTGGDNLEERQSISICARSPQRR